MKNIKLIVVACYCFLSLQNLSAQTYQIKGTVQAGNDSLTFANVALYNMNKKMVTGANTTSQGVFFLTNIAKGNYNLVVSSVGYKTDTLLIQDLSKDLDIGKIYIQTKSTELSSVTITAKSIINKEGIKYVLPTANLVKISTDAVILLDKMNLPRLNVDVNTKQVSVNGGGEVKLCINGREVSGQEIGALKPTDIIRIEYHDKPEARYNNAPVVLDYITKQNLSGGDIYISLWNGLLTPYGEDNISAKYNYKKSEFSASYYLAFRKWKHLWRENKETFYLPNNTLQREESGKPSYFEYYNHTVKLNYNYQDGTKLLNINFKTYIEDKPHYDWESGLLSAPNSHPTLMTDKSKNKSTSPSLNIYYQQPLSKKELLIFNVSGAYSKSDYKRSYKEVNNNLTLTDLKSNVKEEQQIYLFSGLYENKLKAGTFSAGVTHKQSFTTDMYDNLYNQQNSTNTSKLNFGNTYLFSQFGAQIKKFSYRLGIGVNSTRTKADDLQYNYFTFQPSLSCSYQFNDNVEINYYSSVYNTPPSLSARSNYTQRIDSMQFRKGNPDLKRQISYNNAIVFDASLKKMGISVYLNHQYISMPIMETTYLENAKIVRSMENHKNFQSYNGELELRSKPFKDYVTLKAYMGMKYFVSNGNLYSHNQNIYYYGGRLSLNYKKYSLTWTMNQNTNNSFFGETLFKNEDGHMITLAYNTDTYRIAIDGLNLFTKRYISAKENYSQIAPYKRYEYLEEVKNLIRVNFTYNFSFGRKYQSANKKINDSAITESGILKGDK